MHQIEDKTLPSKYSMNELEFRRDELRNGTTVKNGASENIGGSPTRLFVLVLIWDGRVIHLSSRANLRV